MTHSPLKTFIIYARADEEYKRQLLLHLRPLIVSKLLTVWHDGNILPGENWEKVIKKEVMSSELVIVLVSVESLNSEFIQTEELRTALELLDMGLTRVVPVVVSPCVWKFDPIIKKLQALPLAGAEGVRPVSEWSSNHLAWANVVERIGDMVEDIFQKRESNIKAEKEHQEQLQRQQEEATERARQAEANLVAREKDEREQREAAAREDERQRIQQKQHRQKKQAHDLAWQQTGVDHSIAAYEGFLATYPNSEQTLEARRRIKELRRQNQPAVPWRRNLTLGSGMLAVILASWWLNRPGDEKPLTETEQQLFQNTPDDSVEKIDTPQQLKINPVNQISNEEKRYQKKAAKQEPKKRITIPQLESSPNYTNVRIIISPNHTIYAKGENFYVTAKSGTIICTGGEWRCEEGLYANKYDNPTKVEIRSVPRDGRAILRYYVKGKHIAGMVIKVVQ